MLFSRIIRNLRTPWNYICYLNTTKLKYYLPDTLVISCKYRSTIGKKLNLISPKTFNEKLQWLKLYDRNPYYCKLVDKYEVKKIVAKRIGMEHVVPTYDVWNSPDEIDIHNLPETFVLKTTHDSHSIIICDNKASFDIDSAKEKLNISLENNYFYGGREWPYKNVKPRIIAEKYMSNGEKGITDYKIHCFNGQPKFILVCVDRFESSGLKEAFYDLDWCKMPVNRPNCVTSLVEEQKPGNLNEMIKMAETLSAGIPFVRVDFYQINGITYFGEMTFFPASGFKRFIPDEYDEIFGSFLNIHR